MKTIEEVTKEVTQVKKDIQNDIKKIELLAESLNIYAKMEEAQEFSKRLRDIHPILNLGSSNLYLYNGIDSVSRDVLHVLNYPEKTFLASIHFQSIDLKHKTFTTYSDQHYYFYYLHDCFDFTKGIEKTIDLVKAYQNGKHVYKFKNDSDFDKFVKIVFWNSEDTTKLFMAITQEDKEAYKKFMQDKKKCVNVYNFIWELRRDKKLDDDTRTDNINYYLLFDYLGSI